MKAKKIIKRKPKPPLAKLTKDKVLEITGMDVDQYLLVRVPSTFLRDSF